MDTESCLKPDSATHLELVEFSHRGLVRENNEDHILVKSFNTFQTNAQSILLAILADGVGGHRAGEVASCIAVNSIAASVQACKNLDHPESLLEEAFIHANQEIVQRSQDNESQKGMGTTCVSALIIGRKLYMANIGDSRLYLLRNREINQLTFNHTWLEELSESGFSGGPKNSRSHPLAHVLSRYLGSTEPIQVDLRIRLSGVETAEEMRNLQGMNLEAGDILLLNSDGISDLLTDEEIKGNLLKRNWDQSAKRLVYCALKKGGHDNASVIVIRIPANIKKKKT